jgi:hypothetical protein
LSKFFLVNFSFSETIEAEATTEGDSPDDVVQKIRNYYGPSVENLVIHSITELEEAPQIAPPPKSKPNLRIVN